MCLGENIKKLRDERKLTQEQLADALKTSQTIVKDWERGLKVPSLALAVSIAEFFHVKVDDLLK